MINLNLLPWRDEQKSKQEKYLKEILFGSLMIPIILLSLAHYIFTTLIQKQEAQIKKLTSKTDNQNNNKNATPPLNHFLTMLHRYRKESFAIVNQVMMSKEKNICYQTTKLKNNNLIIKGMSINSDDFVNFTQKLNTKLIFSAMEIKKVEQIRGKLHFELKLTTVNKLPLTSEEV